MQKNITISIALCGLLTTANITLAMENLKIVALAIKTGNLQLHTTHHNPETNSPHYSPRSHRELAEFLAAVAQDEGYVYTAPDQSYFIAPDNSKSTLHRSGSVSPIDDYDCTRTPNSSSSSSSQPNSPRKQENTTQNILTGYYTNDLNSATSDLPIHKYINSERYPNDIDGISYKDNNELKTILFGSSIQYKKERFIIVQDDQGQNLFAIEITQNNAAESEETPQDTLQRRQSSKELLLLKSTFSNSSNSDSEKDKETSQEKPQKKYPKYTGYFTNELDSSTSELPTYTFFNGESVSNDVDMIIYNNKKTGNSTTILFSFPKNESNEVIPCNGEKYIVITDDYGRNMFTIEINHDDSTKSTQSSSSQSPNTSSEQITKKGLELVKDKFDSSSGSDDERNQPQSSKEASDFDTEKHKETSVIAHTVDNDQPSQTKSAIDSTSPKQPNPDKSSSFKRTFMGATFIALCVALAYKYNKLPDAFAQLIDKFYAQCSNLISGNLYAKNN